jgi:cell volume regulation protein A
VNPLAIMPDEPRTTAIVLVTVGILVALSALTSRFSGRLGVPLALVFLVIGMAAGTDGVGLQFNDYALTFQLGTLALVLILFDGGLNTPRRVVRQGIKPAAMLATVGVVVTATAMALCAWALGLDPKHAALLGAIVSSTDAAAVFSVLRSSGIQLRRRVGVTLEMESGINDPMAVILTIACTQFVVTGEEPTAWLAAEVLGELLVGGLFGAGIGYGGRALVKRARLAAGGLYPVLTIAIALLAYAVPTLVHGSGFLAVYVSAVMIGDSEIPYRAGVLRVHDAAAWVAQVGMFLVLGLVVTPHKLVDVAWLGLVLGLGMAFIARPLAVAMSLVWFRYPPKELAYIAWVGLRGAVPIVLAIFPVMAGAQGGSEIFHLVFFIVVVNAIIPGSTIRWVTHKLGLMSGEPPPPSAVLEINAMQHLDGKVLAFFVDKASAAFGVAIRDLPFPTGTAVMVIVRAGTLVAPRGDVALQNGDHLYVILDPKDEPLVRLMFGQAAEG